MRCAVEGCPDDAHRASGSYGMCWKHHRRLLRGSERGADPEKLRPLSSEDALTILVRRALALGDVDADDDEAYDAAVKALDLAATNRAHAVDRDRRRQWREQQRQAATLVTLSDTGERKSG